MGRRQVHLVRLTSTREPLPLSVPVGSPMTVGIGVTVGMVAGVHMRSASIACAHSHVRVPVRRGRRRRQPLLLQLLLLLLLEGLHGLIRVMRCHPPWRRRCQRDHLRRCSYPPSAFSEAYRQLCADAKGSATAGAVRFGRNRRRCCCCCCCCCGGGCSGCRRRSGRGKPGG